MPNQLTLFEAQREVEPDADVYCDLQRKCTSVKRRRGENAGRVVAKPLRVVVQPVTFRVQPGTLRSIREKGVRSVCAFARGDTYIDGDVDAVINHPAAVRLHFNPFKFDTFVLEDGTPCHAAQAMAIVGKTAWVVPNSIAA